MNLTHHLNIFNHVTSQGELINGKYMLGSLSAWNDFDGYTCYLGYKDLTMSLYFHSRFSFDYDEEDTFKEFEKLIDKMRLTL